MAKVIPETKLERCSQCKHFRYATSSCYNAAHPRYDDSLCLLGIDFGGAGARLSRPHEEIDPDCPLEDAEDAKEEGEK